MSTKTMQLDLRIFKEIDGVFYSVNEIIEVPYDASADEIRKLQNEKADELETRERAQKRASELIEEPSPIAQPEPIEMQPEEIRQLQATAWARLLALEPQMQTSSEQSTAALEAIPEQSADSQPSEIASTSPEPMEEAIQPAEAIAEPMPTETVNPIVTPSPEPELEPISMTAPPVIETREFTVDDVRKAIGVLCEPGEVYELRIPKTSKKTVSGYYDNREKFAIDVMKLDKLKDVPGIYFTMNPVRRELLARSANRYKAYAESTSSDRDIARRRWLLVDIDAARPSGISSSDEEHSAAIDKAKEIRDKMTAGGWPSPILADSGNGAHLLFKIDLENNDTSTTLVKQCLGALSMRFDDDSIKIDKGVFNAARICKVYGTVTRKGDSTADRPHRRSGLISVPATIETVSCELLEALSAKAPQEKANHSTTSQRTGSTYADRWISKHISDKVKSPKPWNGCGRVWEFLECPWNPEHKGTAYITEAADGKLGGGCHHASCQSYTWHDLRQMYESSTNGVKVVGGFEVSQAIETNQLPGETDLMQRLAVLPFDDNGNGEALAKHHGDRLRYDHQRGRWLLYDKHRWIPDADGEIRRLATLTMRFRQQAAAMISDSDKRKAAMERTAGYCSSQRIANALNEARTILPIADKGINWDSDGMLLGVQNGVIDLRTCELRPGQPQDRITMTAGTEFDSAATCPRTLKFFDEIFSGDQELIRFVQRFVGYALTGRTTEQCMGLLHGSGCNGKSSLLTLLRLLLGDYCTSTPFSTFELSKFDMPTNDLAALRSSRLVIANETAKGKRFNEARIKAVSGGDPITARLLYHDYFTFIPEFKIMLAMNDLPRIDGTDDGIWRRLRIIPFLVNFKGREDPTLAPPGIPALRDELPGVLNWALAGCLAWQKNGLGLPPAVETATGSYRKDSDPIELFFADEDEVIISSTDEVKATHLYTAFCRWTSEEDIPKLSQRAFYQRVADRGIKMDRRKKGRFFIGLRCLSVANSQKTISQEESQGENLGSGEGASNVFD